MVANAKRTARDETLLDEARERVAHLQETAKDEAKALKRQAVEKAEEVTRSVKRESDRFLKEQKSRAAERIERIGSVMHQAAQVLEKGDVGNIAEYVDMAAMGATAASKYLDEREVGELVDDVADIVRRHPLAAFGATIIAGLAVGRFVKAGQPGRQASGEVRHRRTGKRSNR
jgi:hypothetical protein